MPTSRKRGRKEEEPDRSLLQDLLLTIKFPRCSVCELGWFDDDDDDDDDAITVQQDKTTDDYLLLKCKNLVPLPHCNCAMTLLTDADGLDKVFSSAELNHILEQSKQMDEGQITKLLTNKFCIKKGFKRCRNTAMCSECIHSFISSADDVIEHDYMSDAQPNIKFSVGGKCPCCRKKFSARSLNALVGERGKSHGKEMMEWIRNVKSTIQFVGFAKQLKGILRSKLSDNANGSNLGTSADEQGQTMKKWMDDTEEHLSDDCFSDWEPTKRSRIAAYVVAPAAGELKQDLLQKDPLFRQECEDFEYIKQMARTVEGRRELGMEGFAQKPRKSEKDVQLEDDERMARDLEDKINGRKPSKKSPIRDFFQKEREGAAKIQSDVSTPGSSSLTRGKKKKRLDSSIKKFLLKLPESSDSEDSAALSAPSKKPNKHIGENQKGKVEPLPSIQPRAFSKQSATIEILDSDEDDSDGGPVVLVSKDSRCKETDSGKRSIEKEKDEGSISSNSSTCKPEILVICSDDDDAIPQVSTSDKVSNDRSRSSSFARSSSVAFNKVNGTERTEEAAMHENSMKDMQQMGFGREDCLRALKQADNDSDTAVNVLLDERQS